MIGVEQHAGAERFVIREQTRDAPVEPAHIDANAHLHLEQRDDVLDGRVPEAEPLPQFRGVILGLRADVALQERPLRRVVADALHAQEVLEFHLRAREARQQVRRIVDGSIVVAIDLAEARREIDMDGLTAQKRIDRCPEELRELLQLVDADAALALLDRDMVVRATPMAVAAAACVTFAASRAMRSRSPVSAGDNCSRATHVRPRMAQSATNESCPRDSIKASHSLLCCLKSRSSRPRASAGVRPSAPADMKGGNAEGAIMDRAVRQCREMIEMQRARDRVFA